MKLSAVVAAVAFLLASSSAVHADDPLPPEDADVVDDEPEDIGIGDPKSGQPAPGGKPGTPAPDAPKARISDPKPRTPTTARPRVADDGEGRLDKKEDTVAGGKHWRIKTGRGSVHVWIPEDYDRETAGTVVYVHGYWLDADGAWSQHGLAKQFRKSKQNAMFIVPDAPQSNEDNVKWTALKDLRKAVARANIKLPDGPVVVMGHSGAFRTIMQWVDNKTVDQIILLDAMYSGESAFDEFIATGKRADDHKLIVVGAGTAAESSSFAKKYKFAVGREKVPEAISDFSKREKGAKLLYIRSQFEHMQIVTSGKVIPLLLRLTPLKAL